MSLFYASLLTGLHGVAVIDTGALNAVYAFFQSLRVTEFRASVGKDVLKQGSKVPNRFSRRSKTRRTAPLVQRFMRKARKSFSFVKNSVRRDFLESLEECTVSIST